ncbi:MAG: DUF2207 domain-containing protein [Bacilli bacterium]|nr:DUF2207 domain-containing protein [Bacilli bacterium]
MRKKKYIGILMILLFTFLVPNKVNANSEYKINSYNIDIIVNENNTLKITENIEAYFNIQKHGIFRKIPLKNKVVRLNGTTSNNRAKISDIEVSDEYDTYNEDGNKVIKIGSPNYTLIGPKNYTISYLYNLGKDTGKGYDELYFNLIGSEWDTSISNVTFSIAMPKEFDESKLRFSSGKTGSIDSSNITYEVNGNTIVGKLNKTLYSGEALTVRLELPENYFVGESNNFDLMMIIAIVVPILFVLISYLIWLIYGKDNKVIETVEFYPPEGFNSLEVGFMYKGQATNEDVISLLIYLANKGYIKISEYEEKVLFLTSKGFKITKLKEYDGNNINELMFLNGLFIKQPTMYLYGKNNDINENNVNEVTSSELCNKFYITMKQILLNINHKNNKNQIFEKRASNKKIIFRLMVIIIFCLITIPPIFLYSNKEIILFALLFPGIAFNMIVEEIFFKGNTVSKKTKITSNVAVLIWSMFFGGIPWYTMVLPTLTQEYIYLFIYILGLLCIIAISILLNYLPKRTKYGNEILGKILGFKHFLETVEKDRLEAMVMQKPDYFYDILPYTYVLGISDKWINKFETITLKAPSWYDSPTGFNVTSFSHFMNNTMTSAQRTMSSSPSSGSGGSSGGGSSGGGSGGGGGGSW